MILNLDDDATLLASIRRLYALSDQLKVLQPDHELLRITEFVATSDINAAAISLYARFGPPNLTYSEMVNRSAYSYVYTQLIRAFEYAVEHPDDPLVMIRHDPAEYAQFHMN